MLPTEFTFSQQSLQDYMDCPRRFSLKYIQKCDWPAVESEPVLEQEHLVDLGYRFHQLIQQALSGIPQDVIETTIHEPELLRWWNAFQSLDLNLSNSASFVEESLVAPFENFRIMAKFDLLLFDQAGDTLIYDWKTTQSKPSRPHYSRRAQTLVYPLVLALAGSSLAKGSLVDPEKIEMRYWFPEFPEDTLSFRYSNNQHQHAIETISQRIHEIEARSNRDEFEKTGDQKKCKFCRFRSLCERGIEAGEVSDESPIEPDEVNPFEIEYDL